MHVSHFAFYKLVSRHSKFNFTEAMKNKLFCKSKPLKNDEPQNKLKTMLLKKPSCY